MKEQNRGFEFFYNESVHILKLRVWGLWDADFAEQYHRQLCERVRKIEKKSPHGWCVLADLNEFPTQVPEVQNIIVRGMEFCIQHGLKRDARLVGQPLTNLQFKRLVKEADMPEDSTFQSEAQAIDWLSRA
jgi:hypothetical protein